MKIILLLINYFYLQQTTKQYINNTYNYVKIVKRPLKFKKANNLHST